MLTDAVDKDRYNKFGINSGASSHWVWQMRKLDLMSEIQVTGATEWSSSGFEIGIDNEQMPLFKLASKYKQIGKYKYWLRSVATIEAFAVIERNNESSVSLASLSGGIRPYFYID